MTSLLCQSSKNIRQQRSQEYSPGYPCCHSTAHTDGRGLFVSGNLNSHPTFLQKENNPDSSSHHGLV